MQFYRGHKLEYERDPVSGLQTMSPKEYKGIINLPCGYCNKKNTPEDHDGCLGTLPGVMNACCGHGDIRRTYVMFDKDHIMREEHAREFCLEHGISMW